MIFNLFQRLRHVLRWLFLLDLIALIGSWDIISSSSGLVLKIKALIGLPIKIAVPLELFILSAVVLLVEVLFIWRLIYLKWLGFNSLYLGCLSDLLGDLSFNLLVVVSIILVLLIFIIINFAWDSWMTLLARIGRRNWSRITSRFIWAICVLLPGRNHRRALILFLVSLMIPRNCYLILTTGVIRLILSPGGIRLLNLLRHAIVTCWCETRIVAFFDLRTQLSLRFYWTDVLSKLVRRTILFLLVVLWVIFLRIELLCIPHNLVLKLLVATLLTFIIRVLLFVFLIAVHAHKTPQPACSLLLFFLLFLAFFGIFLFFAFFLRWIFIILLLLITDWLKKSANGNSFDNLKGV